MSSEHADVVRDSVARVAADVARPGASATFEPGEAGDPAVILSWTAAAP